MTCVTNMAPDCKFNIANRWLCYVDRIFNVAIVFNFIKNTTISNKMERRLQIQEFMSRGRGHPNNKWLDAICVIADQSK